ncbi:membrane protein insertase YidC [Ruminobacter sp. RM87]|uniref:membrane protein insertase YidC n=1 Tax=Ruminobacter sp. RM87 TaxID=1200567 RepID=UPI00056AB8F3|nr:membrane protein insertase YidC [Ruminobacter sp. RM87]
MHTQRSSALMFFSIVSVIAVYTYFADKDEAAKKANQPQLEVVSGAESSSQNTPAFGEKIQIETDLHSIQINLNGGDIVTADLKDQKQNIDSDENFHLFKYTPDYKYYATSDVVIEDLNQSRYLLHPNFSSEKTSYVMNAVSDIDCQNLSNEDNQKLAKLSVPLTYTDKNGTVYTKTFTFTQCKHVVNVDYAISNISKDMSIAMESKLIQSVAVPDNSSGVFMASAYRGSAFSNSENKYSKISFDDIVKKNYDTVSTAEGGWVSMIQHYFVSSWIGLAGHQNTVFTQSADNGATAIIGISSAPVNIKASPDAKIKLSNNLWIGPKIQEEMKDTSNNLDLTIDYGWLSFISSILFKCLKFIHGFVHNWGFAIIILTLLVRGLMFTLTKKQYESMAKMKQLAPKLNQLKEKYKNDKQRLSQETMRLYQTEKVNPLGGCLPMLIQMPIFIALYWTLMESTELRHSPFIFWIKDLSVLDPYYVLPLLMGLTMFLTQRMSMSSSTDPTQKTVMTVMTVVFTFMFCTFPAGLTLYWVTSNIITIIQQTVIYRHLEKKGLSMRAKNK